MNFHFTYLGFRADALHPRLYAADRIRGLRTRQNVGNDKVSNLPHTPAVGRLETCPTLFRRRSRCLAGSQSFCVTYGSGFATWRNHPTSLLWPSFHSLSALWRRRRFTA